MLVGRRVPWTRRGSNPVRRVSKTAFYHMNYGPKSRHPIKIKHRRLNICKTKMAA